MHIDKTGSELLESPLLNRGTGFTEAERKAYGLLGLLPPAVETLEEQTLRSYEAYQQKTTDIERHIFLRSLQHMVHQGIKVVLHVGKICRNRVQGFQAFSDRFKGIS